MTSEKLDRYRQALLELRRQVQGDAAHVADSIREDVNIHANISAAPVHLADAAGASVDADVKVLEAERGIFDQIDAALKRLDAGTFGLCEECGGTISEQRLQAIPFTSVCAGCAEEGD
jgi:DnaK suppressor protein